MARLQFRQQERLFRQASQPPEFLLNQQESVAATEKARRRGRRKATDPDDKVPHNAIERRYRDNINERIATLRAAVPALRDLTPKNNGGSSSLLPRKPRRKGEPEDLVDGVSAATKLNKATILGKATEYIHYLKKRETQLSAEAEGLKELIRSLQGGEDVLLVWMHEMEQTRSERAAEKARLEALLPIKEEEKGDQVMDDLLLESDDEVSSGSQGDSSLPGPSQQAGSYMMAAFLGLTLISNSSDLQHHPNAPPHPAARAASASHQLLKRISLSPSTAQHHFDHVPPLTLILEVARFVSFVVCFLFVLYPVYRTLTKQGSNLPSEDRSPRQTSEGKATLRQRHAALFADLSSSRSSPASMDQALRTFLSAPRGAIGAGSTLVRDLLEWAHRKALYSPQPSSAPPALLATHSQRVQADVWVQLLEVETAWGAFAQRSLALKVHTILHVARIASSLDESEPEQSTLTRATESETETETESEVVPDRTTERVHALLALALGRLGSPDNAVGRVARQWARSHWSAAYAYAASKRGNEWFRSITSQPLEQALTLSPTEADAAQAAGPDADPETRMFLSSPLLMLSNTVLMASLYRVWTLFFPCIIAASSPTTFGARARRLRETQTESENGEAGSEPSTSMGINPFLREFFGRHQAGLLSLDLDALDCDSKKVVSTLEASLVPIQEGAARGTPAYYLALITLSTWAFVRGDRVSAQKFAQPLLQGLRSNTNLLGARGAARACLQLISPADVALDHPEPAKSSPLQGLEDDKGIFALVCAGLQWLLLLRGLGNNKAVFQPVDGGAGTETLLSLTIDVRRTLAHAAPLQSRAMIKALELVPLLSTDEGITSNTMTLPEAKEAATDVLADLSRFLGTRSRQSFVGAGTPSHVDGGVPVGGLLWIPEESDIGLGM